jgi:DMSO reductase anchor subunit
MNTEVSRKLTISLTLLRIIFGALLFGMISFLTAMSIIITPGSQHPESNELFQLIAPIFMVISVSTCIFLRKSMLAKVHNETNPSKLIKAYTSSKIVQMALMDASILFAIVCYMLTTNTYFVLLGGLGILYFGSLFPLQKKVIQQLNLDNPIGY